MNTIIVKNICDTCLTQEDGIKLQNVLKPYFEKQEKVDLDFESMEKYVTLFFNYSIGYFILNYTPELFEKLVSTKNLNVVGTMIYSFSADNAKRIFYENRTKKTNDKITKITKDAINNN